MTHRLELRNLPSRLRADASPAMLAAAPVALVGALIHFVPYQIVKRVTGLPKDESVRSTVKLLGCTISFLIDWLGLGSLVWRNRGPLAGAVAAVASPLSGYVGIRVAETLRDQAAPPANETAR